MATIKLADGRGELYQFDTGRKVVIDDETIKQVHYQNRFYGRTIDVDVSDGAAIIPDQLLQSFAPLVVFAWAGSAEDGYTKIEKTFEVHKRNKPADYVYTPTDQMTLQTIQRQIGDLADLTTEAKDTLVAAINELALSSGAGSMSLRVADGYIQYSTDSGITWTNLIAVAELKGAKGDHGDPGKGGHSPVVTATKSGKTTTISVDGTAIATVEDGADGAPGKDGSDGKPGAAGVPGKDGTNGITPHIGDNGNWYLGATDTGKPSRGATGAKGDVGATGPAGPVGPQGPAGAPGKDGADGETGPQGPKGDPGTPGAAGAPGKDGAGMDITGATVGQIAKITAVDASGVPTAWSPADMPSGGSPDAVLYTAQALTDAQKKQARANVDAASEFVVTATQDSSGGVALDKTFAQIHDAVSMGKTPVMRSPLTWFQLLLYDDTNCIFGSYGPGRNGVSLSFVLVSKQGARAITLDALSANPDGTLSQRDMASAPTEDMQIATKLYVDDTLNGKGYLTLDTLPKYEGATQ
nr:MAG TPA: collagen I alpha 1 [Caudoviricetes sp.]